MNSEVWVLELSDREFSATTPLLEKKKADRVLRFAEAYLVGIIGMERLSSSWCEIKEAGSWQTEFLFKFPEPQPGARKAIEFALNQELKEGEMTERTKVWEISDGVIFVALRPPLEKEKLERIQTEILEYVKRIDRFALAGKISQRKGISYFRITTPHPWPELKKAVELGLEKGLKEVRKEVEEND
ncbi:hypothetical protein GW869_00205 [bacterium]|nr:hypothetical protein [bacterium]